MSTETKSKRKTMPCPDAAPNITTSFTFAVLGKAFELKVPAKLSNLKLDDDGRVTGGGNPWFEGEQSLVLADDKNHAAAVGETEQVSFITDKSDKAILESFRVKYEGVELSLSDSGIVKTAVKEIWGGTATAGGNLKANYALGGSVMVEGIERPFTVTVTAMILTKRETKSRPAFRFVSVKTQLVPLPGAKAPTPLRQVGEVNEIASFD